MIQSRLRTPSRLPDELGYRGQRGPAVNGDENLDLRGQVYAQYCLEQDLVKVFHSDGIEKTFHAPGSVIKDNCGKFRSHAGTTHQENQ